MSGQDVADQIAKPGDADLDLDLDGATLTDLVVFGTDLIITFEGGYGAFVATDGTLAVFAPGDDSGEIGESVLNVGYTDPDPDWLAKVVERLESWRARSVPLRICSAPGRMTTVIEDRSCWLPFPRRAPN